MRRHWPAGTTSWHRVPAPRAGSLTFVRIDVEETCLGWAWLALGLVREVLVLRAHSVLCNLR